MSSSDCTYSPNVDQERASVATIFKGANSEPTHSSNASLRIALLSMECIFFTHIFLDGHRGLNLCVMAGLATCCYQVMSLVIFCTKPSFWLCIFFTLVMDFLASSCGDLKALAFEVGETLVCCVALLPAKMADIRETVVLTI
jgi:hypothetical protein